MWATGELADKEGDITELPSTLTLGEEAPRQDGETIPGFWGPLLTPPSREKVNGLFHPSGRKGKGQKLLAALQGAQPQSGLPLPAH